MYRYSRILFTAYGRYSTDWGDRRQGGGGEAPMLAKIFPPILTVVAKPTMTLHSRFCAVVIILFSLATPAVLAEQCERLKATLSYTQEKAPRDLSGVVSETSITLSLYCIAKYIAMEAVLLLLT